MVLNPKILASGAGIAAVAIAIVVLGLMYDEPQSFTVTTSDGIMVTDGLRHTIPLEKIRSGGPPKDGIPSIDDPKFASSDAPHVSDDDIVIGLEINGDARAYPLYILVWHEIVNDNVGGVPVAVTYCPLCYTSQVFERIIDGESVEFGTSGKLYNSNLVMYDRLTDSYWSQALGVAITGKLAGEELSLVPFDLIMWKDWKELHPDSVVLTTDTGHIRAYGQDPYGDYYTQERIIFPVENLDDRMHPKEIVLGLEIDGIHKAYRQQDIEDHTVINDILGDTPIVLMSLYPGDARVFERTIDGAVFEFSESSGTIMDQHGTIWSYDGHASDDTASLTRIGSSPGFWFEWVAFHPDTLVYGEQ